MSDTVEVVARAIAMAEEETTDAQWVNALLAVTEHSGDCTDEPFSCFACAAEGHRGVARAAISAHLSALKEAGMVVVPQEPTRAMKDAALKAMTNATVDEPKAAAWDGIIAYRAMIVASEESSNG